MSRSEARRYHVTLTRRLESVAQCRGVREHRKPLRRQDACLIAALDQRLKSEAAALFHLEAADSRGVDVVECSSNDVLGVEARLVEANEGDVPRGLASARADAQCLLQITDHLARIELQAPRVEQRPKGRARVRTHVAKGVPGLRRTRRISLRARIDEHERAPATQHELVDGIENRLRQSFRMHEHQHVDVGVNGRGLGRHWAHREQLTELLTDDPGVAHLPGHLVEVHVHRQGGQQADHRLLRLRQLDHELGDVLFEELVFLGLKKVDDCAAIGGVGPRETELQSLS